MFKCSVFTRSAYTFGQYLIFLKKMGEGGKSKVNVVIRYLPMNHNRLGNRAVMGEGSPYFPPINGVVREKNGLTFEDNCLFNKHSKAVISSPNAVKT